MKTSAPLPPPDVEAARAAYLDRFGPLFDTMVCEDEGDTPFSLLSFWDAGRPGAPVVYASLGAPLGDVFITAVSPGLGISTLIAKAAAALPPDTGPIAIVTAHARGTPFVGALVLRDGGFDVPAVDGSTRTVRRLVAFTRREQGLGMRRGVKALLRELREARADIADVCRACTVAPDVTRGFLFCVGPATVRRLRSQLADLARTIDASAPGADLDRVNRRIAAISAGLAHYEAALPHVPTPAEIAAARAKASPDEQVELAVAEVVQTGLDFVVDDLWWDPEVLEEFEVFLTLFFESFPDTRPLVEAVAAGRTTLPAPQDLSPVDHQNRLHACVHRAAEIVACWHPGHDPGALRARALEALGKPRDVLDPDYEPVLTASTGWPIAVRALIAEAVPTSTCDERAIVAAYKMGLTACSGFGEEREPDEATPFDRLATKARHVAFLMMYGLVLGRDMEQGKGAVLS